MDRPVIAKRGPAPVDVEAGRKYFWCACGRSRKQPFCDGSHKTTAFTPLAYEATESRRLFFCCCKHSKGAPLCDGTHNTLPDDREAPPAD